MNGVNYTLARKSIQKSSLKFGYFFKENVDNQKLANYTKLVCASRQHMEHLFYKQEVKPNANI